MNAAEYAREFVDWGKTTLFAALLVKHGDKDENIQISNQEWDEIVGRIRGNRPSTFAVTLADKHAMIVNVLERSTAITKE